MCVKFQRYPLKYHAKFRTHTPQNLHFTRCWKFGNLWYLKVMISEVLVKRAPGMSDNQQWAVTVTKFKNKQTHFYLCINGLNDSKCSTYLTVNKLKTVPMVQFIQRAAYTNLATTKRFQHLMETLNSTINEMVETAGISAKCICEVFSKPRMMDCIPLFVSANLLG